MWSFGMGAGAKGEDTGDTPAFLRKKRGKNLQNGDGHRRNEGQRRACKGCEMDVGKKDGCAGLFLPDAFLHAQKAVH